MLRQHLFALLLIAVSSASLLAEGVNRERLQKLDAAVEASIHNGECPGAVLLVLHRDEVIYRKAFGKRDANTPMTVDTVFDLASLTKPLATAASLMVLVENGSLRLTDPVAKYWPEFRANGKGSVTLEQCLLHTSGLIADNAESDYTAGRETALQKIAELKLEAEPGTRFRYSDVGYIVLGEIVARVSKKPLNEFARDNLFAPLQMTDTGYLPSAELKKRTAPTGKRKTAIILGEVHDPRAFALGGVAGHAGLFGTADDLARFAKMLLHQGEFDGKRILAPLTVTKFTEPKAVPGGLRSRGWDVDTAYSGLRGELFPAGEGFGHTGFTGTSIWIDPPSQTAVILLTNRTFLGERVNMNDLRRKVGTLVAAALPMTPRTTPKPRNGPPVLTGLDVLVRDKFASLKGKNVALVTNHTGLTADGKTAIDLLHAAEGVKLVALFSPEHGIRGELDKKVADSKDIKTGLPIYSLYGERRKPTAEQLEGIDTIVYDIQDIGCRFYTYISTLGLILEAAEENHLAVVVLDRPNPLGGVRVEGPVRDAGKSVFVGYHEIPVRHGMTAGELATLFYLEHRYTCPLKIVKCENWHRRNGFDYTGLTWRNPSPNMRHLNAALLYPGVGLLETTNISVGRGTERPFEWIGAPWMDGPKLAAELNKLDLPGVRFVPVSRTPNSSVHKDRACAGVDLVIEDRNTMRPVSLGLSIALTLRKLYPNDWNTKNFNTLLLHRATHDAVLSGKALSVIEAQWAEELERFQIRRAKALLYE